VCYHVLPSDKPSVLSSDEPSSVLPSDELSVSFVISHSSSHQQTIHRMSQRSKCHCLPSDEPSVLLSDDEPMSQRSKCHCLPSDEPSVLSSDEPSSVLPSDELSVSFVISNRILNQHTIHWCFHRTSQVLIIRRSIGWTNELSVMFYHRTRHRYFNRTMSQRAKCHVLSSDEPSDEPSSVLPSDELSVSFVSSHSSSHHQTIHRMSQRSKCVLPSDEPSVLLSIIRHIT
jgi:hypothetical protein